MTQTDHSLIEAFQRGDEFAFVALYNRYKGPVYAFCAKMLLDRAAAQDVMQEAFVRGLEEGEEESDAESDYSGDEGKDGDKAKKLKSKGANGAKGKKAVAKTAGKANKE